MAQKSMKIYLNGKLVPEEEAKLSVFDRCFLYGDGVFEGIAVWNRAPFRADAHLDRLFAGLDYLHIESPLDRAGWLDVFDEIVAANDMEDGYLRLQLSRGEGMSSIKWERRLLRKPEPNVVVIPIPGFRDYYKGLFAQKAEQGLRGVVVSRPRIASAAIPSGMKHCNYLNSVLGAIEVTDAKVDIGVAVDRDGFVTEGIAYNLFIVKNGGLVTAPLDRDILPGITRDVVLELARGAGIRAEEKLFDAYAMTTADEIFICSTLELAVPVVEIDGRKIGSGKPGPVTRRMGEMLIAEMDAEAARYHASRKKGGARKAAGKRG
ncbi:MAG: aminotransferase class IV [Dongiaceae bacterium]